MVHIMKINLIMNIVFYYMNLQFKITLPINFKEFLKFKFG